MYKNIKSVLASAVAVCVFPVCSYADYVVTNNTHFYSTASAKNTGTGIETACSSSLQDAGRMKPVDQAPENQLKIPDGMVFMFCNPSCEVTVYMSKECDARKIAVVSISPDKGIGEPQNIPNAEGMYLLRKNDHEITIEGGPKK